MDLAEFGIVVKSDQVVKAAGDLDKLTVSSDKAEKSVNKLSTTASNSEKSFEKLKGPLSELNKLFATLGIAFTFEKVIEEFSQFESQLIRVRNSTGLTGKSLEEIGKQAEELSHKIPLPTNEILKLVEASAQAGVKGTENLLKFAETVGKLGSVSDLAGEQAARGLAKILTITKQSYGDVDRLGSTIIKLSVDFGSSATSIAEASALIAKRTSLFKLSADETSAIGAAILKVGGDAEQGALSVSMAMNKIDDAVKKNGNDLKQFANVAGVSSTEFKKAYGQDAVNGFLLFIDGLNKIYASGGNVVDVLDKLGLDSSRLGAVFGLLAANAGVVNDALKDAREAWQSNSELSKQFNEAVKSLGAQFELFKNKISDVEEKIGKFISPYILSAIHELGNALGILARNFDSIGKAIEIAGAVLVGKYAASLITVTKLKYDSIAASYQQIKASQLEIATILEHAKANQIVAAAKLESAIASQKLLQQEVEVVPVRAAANVAVIEATAAYNAATTTVITYGAALANASIMTKVATTATELLSKALKFLGGPWGLVITGLISAYLLLKDNTDEATDAQDKYNEALKEANNIGKTAIDQTEESAAKKQFEARATLLQAQAEDKLRLARLESYKAELEKVEKAGGSAASYEQLPVVTRQTEETKQKLKEEKEAIDALNESIANYYNMGEKEQTVTSQVGIIDTKILNDTILKLQQEQAQLIRLKTATEQGGDAIRKVTAAIDAENIVTEQKIAKGGEEEAQIYGIVEANSKLKQSIDVTNQIKSIEAEIVGINRLTEAYNQGGEAVRKANALNETENILREKGLDDINNLTEAQKRERAAIIELNAVQKPQAQINQDTQKEIHDLEIKIDQQKRLNAAYLEGEEAVRKVTAAIAAENAVRETGANNSADVEKIHQLQDELSKVEYTSEQQKNLEESLKKPFDNALEGIQQAWTDGFRKLLDGNINSFKDFGSTLMDIFKQMLAEMATLALVRPVIVPVMANMAGAFGMPTVGNSILSQFGLGSIGSSAATTGFTGNSIASMFGGGTSSIGSSLALPKVISGFSTTALGGFNASIANIGTSGYFGGFGANMSLASNAAQGGAYGTAFGAVAPYLAPLMYGLTGYMQNGIKGALMSGGGSAIGAAIGSSLAPGIGTIIGGVLGGSLGSVFGAEKNLPDRPKLRFTLNPAAETTALFDENAGYTKQAIQSAQTAAIDATKTVSKALDQIGVDLTKTQYQFTTRSGQIKLRQGGTEFATIGEVGSRMSKPTEESFQQAYQQLAMQIAKQSAIEAGGEVATAAKNSVAKTIDDLLADIKFAKDLTEGTLFDPKTINDAQKAIDDLNTSFDAMKDKADQLKLSSDSVAKIEAERAKQIEKLTTDFNKSIQDQLEAINNSSVGSLKQLYKTEQDRIDNAKTLGADLVEVEKLNYAEREKAIEQIFSSLNDVDSIKKFVDEITKLNNSGDELANKVLPQVIDQFNKIGKDFSTSITDQILAIQSPLLSQLEDQRKIADERLDNAKKLGADLVQVEKLNALERKQIIEQAFSGIKDLQESLNLSQYSPATPQERYTTAQQLFDVTAAQAKMFDQNAIQALPNAAQQLLTEAQSMFAGTKEYQDIFIKVNQTLNDILDFGNNLTSINQSGKFDQNTIESINQAGKFDSLIKSINQNGQDYLTSINQNGSDKIVEAINQNGKEFDSILTSINQSGKPIIEAVDQSGKQSVQNTSQIVDAIKLVVSGNNDLSHKLDDIFDNVLRMLSSRSAA